MFQLWCHDKIGINTRDGDVFSELDTPSINGQSISLRFLAINNENIRIHLQYTPGEGRIEVSDVRIKLLD